MNKGLKRLALKKSSRKFRFALRGVAFLILTWIKVFVNKVFQKNHGTSPHPRSENFLQKLTSKTTNLLAEKLAKDLIVPLRGREPLITGELESAVGVLLHHSDT